MKLPVLKPDKILKILYKMGFSSRPGKGSHLVFRHADGRRTTVSMHNQPVTQGTLKAILNQIKISKEEFMKWL